MAPPDRTPEPVHSIRTSQTAVTFLQLNIMEEDPKDALWFMYQQVLARHPGSQPVIVRLAVEWWDDPPKPTDN
jgi:hypothetical protein